MDPKLFRFPPTERGILTTTTRTTTTTIFTIMKATSSIQFWHLFLIIISNLTRFSLSFVPIERGHTPFQRGQEEQQQRLQQQQQQHVLRNSDCHEENSNPVTLSRRNLFQDYFLPAVLGGGTVAILTGRPDNSNAAMANSQKVFEVGKDLTPTQAKARFKEGQKSLDYLLEHYDEICEGGGDNVRRYLGTVGTTSGLYGIQKVMKLLQDEADDIVEYTETMNEVNAALQGADGSAYMAIFTVTSTSGVPPEKYFGDAKIEATRAKRSMQDIAAQLDIR